MGNEIRITLIQLGKKQIDLIHELKKKAVTVTPSEMSGFLNGVYQTPKAKMVMEMVYQIIKEWECE